MCLLDDLYASYENYHTKGKFGACSKQCIYFYQYKQYAQWISTVSMNTTRRQKKIWQVRISVTKELFAKTQFLCQNKKPSSKFGFD